MEDACAVWTTAAGRCEYRDEAVPTVLAPGEVVVESLFGAVSRGTESLVVHGLVPVSEHERMKCPQMAGSFDFPVKYGYSVVGRVAEAHDSSRVGELVFCLHPHQTRFVTSGATSIGATPARRAVLAPNLETAINVVWDAKIGVGDRVAVVGCGVIGSLVSWLASRIPGTQVAVYDTTDRADLLRKLLPEGLHRFERLNNEVLADFGLCDVVVNASGSSAGLATALNLAADEGLVLEASWHGSNVVHVPLGEAFHSKRLTIRSSQVGQLPPDRRPRWDYARRLALAIQLASAPELDALFDDDDIPFIDLATRLPKITAKGATGLCHRIDYKKHE